MSAMPVGEDIESRSHSDEEHLVDVERTSVSASTRHLRVAIGVVGSIALVTCGVLASFSTTRGAAPKEDAAEFSVRSLLDSPEMHRVATDNILNTIGHQHTIEHRDHVHSIVQESFLHVNRQLEEHSPEVTRAFETAKLTEEQKNAVLHSMRYLSDPRVQKLGLKVAQAVRDADSNDPEVLKNAIARKLGSQQLHEMQHLSKEMFQAPVRGLLAGGGLQNLLEPHRLKLMKTVDDSWDLKFTMTQPKEVKPEARRLSAAGWAPPATAGTNTAAPAAAWGAPTKESAASSSAFKPSEGLKKAEKGVGIAGAVVTEAAALLRIMKPLAKVFHNDLNVNPWVTSAIALPAGLLEIASCEVNAAKDGSNPVEMAACPMEFGSECFDAMREVMTLTGVLGNNNPDDGVQGNHNGQTKVEEGIFDPDPSKPVSTSVFQEKGE